MYTRVPPERHRRRRWLAIGLTFCAAPSAGVAAQIAGSVTDRESGAPIASALVQIIARDSSVLATAFTNALGAFAFDRSPPDDGHLYVARLGYRAERAAVHDLPADRIALGIRLDRDPVELDAIAAAVSARQPALQNVGFYDRQRLAFGRFITRDIIEERSPGGSISDLLRPVQGVVRVEDSFDSAIVFLRAPSTSLRENQQTCPAVVYVDGIYRGRELPRFHLDEVEAIEVFRGPSEVPAQFGGASAACGVILLWLRTGEGS